MKFQSSKFKALLASARCGFVITTALFLLACCTSSNNRVPGYLYLRLQAAPSTLDPALITDVPGGGIAAKLYDGLVKIGGGLKIKPDVARSWTVSPDGRHYDFSLRKGVRFSNGREVRASDFQYSFERVLSSKTLSPNTWVLNRISGAKAFMGGKAAHISGIKVKGPYEIELTLDKPFSPFLGLLAMPTAYVVAREGNSPVPIGCGPFTVQKWLPGQELMLKARRHYFAGPPKIKGIVYRVIPEDLTAVVEFETGNLDILGIPESVYGRFKNDPFWSRYVTSTDGINTYYLGLNCSRPPFNDRKLRQAVSYAIDRQKILETYFEGRGVFATGPVPPELRGWAAPKAYEYNPAKARQLIKEAGYKDLKAEFYVTNQEEVLDMAEIIQQYLSRVGIQVKIKQLEWNSYKEAINNGEPDMFWLSWWADYPDPENFLFPLFDSANIGPAGNRTRYSDPVVDKLIEDGQNASTVAARDRYYSQAEHIIAHDAPWVFFWHRKDIVVRSPRVRGYKDYPVYSMDKATEISLDASK
ncbi:MAG: ABC transporter substrate-binding protein [Actinomycetota bacterium]|nr:ABC transporter substrate-binding protein [Actinomycetota bacterium]